MTEACGDVSPVIRFEVGCCADTPVNDPRVAPIAMHIVLALDGRPLRTISPLGISLFAALFNLSLHEGEAFLSELEFIVKHTTPDLRGSG